jgi:hypothetical protein
MLESSNPEPTPIIKPKTTRNLALPQATADRAAIVLQPSSSSCLDNFNKFLEKLNGRSPNSPHQSQ